MRIGDPNTYPVSGLTYLSRDSLSASVTYLFSSSKIWWAMPPPHALESCTVPYEVSEIWWVTSNSLSICISVVSYIPAKVMKAITPLAPTVYGPAKTKVQITVSSNKTLKTCKGSLKNYADQIFPNFDHLPPIFWDNVDISPTFGSRYQAWTTYLAFELST